MVTVCVSLSHRDKGKGTEIFGDDIKCNVLLEWRGGLLMHINLGPFPFITSNIKTPGAGVVSHTKS